MKTPFASLRLRVLTIFDNLQFLFPDHDKWQTESRLPVVDRGMCENGPIISIISKISPPDAGGRNQRFNPLKTMD